MNKKQASNGFTGLLLILVIIVALILIVRGCGSKGNVLDDLPDSIESTSPESSTDPSDAPDESPSPSPSESPTPSPSMEPTPTPAPAITASGSFKSDTGVGLNIIAEWHAASAGNGKVTVTVDMYLDSYSINVNAAPGSAIFTIGDKTLSANVSKIEVDSKNSTVKTLIASQSATFDMSGSSLSLPISAKWMFGGTYSGKDFDSIEASGTASIS